MSKKHIVVTISKSFHIRNLIYSELFERLKTDFEVTVLFNDNVTVPPEGVALMSGVKIVSLKVREPKYEKYFAFIRKNVFAGLKRTQTYNLISELEQPKSMLLYKVTKLLNSILGRYKIFGTLWSTFEGLFINGSEFDHILKNSHMVICQNYGTEGFETRVLRSSNRVGCVSVAIVPSWDNLSSKGVISKKPDFLFVWNQQMKEEAMQLHYFDKNAVKIVGALQFDHYMHPNHGGGNVEAQTTQIVYTTVTPKYFKYNLDVLECIIDMIERGVLPANTSLIARIHPQVLYDKAFGEDICKYQDLAENHECLQLSIPAMSDWGIFQVPMKSDFNHLKHLLSHSTAVLSPASTIMIDAACVGTPSIGLGFDGRKTLKYNNSVRRMFDFTHLKYLKTFNCFEIAYSTQDFASIFSRIINNAAYRVNEMQSVVKHVADNERGDSSDRILVEINEILRK